MYSVAYPTITPTNTVNPPYTINTPVPIVATNASLAGFTPSLPYVGTLRSQGFNEAADPMVHQYNFNIEYQLTNSWLLATSYSGLLGRDLSSMFINENQLPFSAALSRHIGTPGLDVQQMLTRVRAEVVAVTQKKQVPWSNSSLLGEVYLAQ